MLRSAIEHYRTQQRILTATLAQARRLWAAGNLGALTVLVTQMQTAAASDASDAVPAMLAEQGLNAAAATTLGTVVPAAFSGIASDGRALRSLLGLIGSRRQLDLIVATQIQDAARVAGGVAIATRPEVRGYVRMLNPPSCRRCVVLAGKWFRWNDGFDRHPGCDCRHVPAAEDDPNDLRTHPDRYFDSLTREQQDATFGKAGAQAIRDGADISQVVNARRGMRTASIGGRNVRITTEGTTRHGWFEHVRREIDRQRGTTTHYTATDVGRRGAVEHYRERRTARPRLMPEQIYAIAGDDREEAVRLLAGNGYVTPAAGKGTGSVARVANSGRTPPPPPRPPRQRTTGGGHRRPTVGELIPGSSEPAELERVQDGLSEVLARRYGPLIVRPPRIDTESGLTRAGAVAWTSQIVTPDGAPAGETQRTYWRADDGSLYAEHDYLTIARAYRRDGFGLAYSTYLEQWYRESGVSAIQLTAGLGDGGYVWARARYYWAGADAAQGPSERAGVIPRLRRAVQAHAGSPREILLARDVLRRFETEPFGSLRYPTPDEVARIGFEPGRTVWLGKSVMRGSQWHGVKRLG